MNIELKTAYNRLNSLTDYSKAWNSKGNLSKWYYEQEKAILKTIDRLKNSQL